MSTTFLHLPQAASAINKANLNAILAVSVIAFNTDMMAADLAKSGAQAAEKNIRSEYRLACARCDAFTGNTKIQCMVDALHARELARQKLQQRPKSPPNLDDKMTTSTALPVRKK